MMSRNSLESVTLSSLFSAQAAKAPQQVALQHGGKSWTYLDLHKKAKQLAGILQARGVHSGSLVTICGDRSPDYIVAMLATVLAGGAYLPLDPALPAVRREAILADAKPAVILAARDVSAVFERADVVALEEELRQERENVTFVAAPSSPEDLAYVMYTSGSTGKPKGVCIAQRGILRLVHGSRYATLGSGVRMLQNSPLTFDASTFEVWGSLLNGGTCVLMHSRPSLQDLEDVLTGDAVSTLFLTTALFVELTDKRPEAFRNVREVLTGGEPIPPASVKHALITNPGLNVIACYGPTECTTFASTHRYTSNSEVGDVIPLGKPIEQTEFYLLDEDLTPVPVGEEGELYIGGAGLAQGYLNQPELTARAFLQNPFISGSKIYRTGDRGLRSPDGSLVFKGRSDRQIKLRGFRIEIEEIEAALTRHPSVQSAYVKFEQAASDKMLIAYAVPTKAAVTPDPQTDQARFDARTEEWRQVYSRLLYKSLASSDFAGNDPTFNTSGWKSTFDGRPISQPEMEEHVRETVTRILSLSPKRILEIGCGTGLLLFRLVPHCQLYVGTDFSQAALDYVQQKLPGLPGADRVTLIQGMAHELPQPPAGEFDLVIINSVTEHFASAEYLKSLLNQVSTVVTEGGYIFVGDNRNFKLLPLFHAAVQLAKCSGTTSLSAFSLLAEQAAADEQQLTIDPQFFAQLDRDTFRKVSVQLRRGAYHNELTGYRYDATLQVGTGQQHLPVASRAWQDGAESLPNLRQFLADHNPDQLVFTGVSNARLKGAPLLLDAVASQIKEQTTGELRRKMEQVPVGEDPEQFWRLGEELAYNVQVIPSRKAADGRFDVVFRRQANELFDMRELACQPSVHSLHELANDPLLACRKDEVALALRTHLEARLPEYAVPSFIVMLPRFPLNANGKIDFAALPAPARLSSADLSTVVSEGNAVERQILTVWERVLGIRNISLHERFFEIGGDSLKAVRVAEELSRSLGASISPALLFEEPTAAGLARRVSQGAAILQSPAPKQTTLRGVTRRVSVQRRQLATTI